MLVPLTYHPTVPTISDVMRKILIERRDGWEKKKWGLYALGNRDTSEQHSESFDGVGEARSHGFGVRLVQWRLHIDFVSERGPRSKHGQGRSSLYAIVSKH